VASVFLHSSYRTFLKEQLAERLKRNPAYSARGFAQRLGITPPFLSEILKGKKNISGEKALQFSVRLGLETEEAEYFSLLAQLETVREPLLRESLLNRMGALNPHAAANVQDLSVDQFRSISDWYHLAIRNMTALAGFQLTPRNVAKRLGISTVEAELAIERLLRLGLIEKVPGTAAKFRKPARHSMVQSKAPNSALRAFHRQMMEKAIRSLETQSPQEKVVASQTIAIAEDSVEEADRLVDQFLRKFRKLTDNPKPKTQVYHLGIQFFNLTNGDKRRYEPT
jgi:uncharacterized protein (TIGR02147 family)